MPTTPNGYRYPDPTELVKDGAAAIQNLATDADTYAGRSAAGVGNIVINGVNKAQAVFNFPAGRFTAIPIVVTSPSTAGSAWITGVLTTSTTQVTVQAQSVSGAVGGASPLGVCWIARAVG